MIKNKPTSLRQNWMNKFGTTTSSPFSAASQPAESISFKQNGIDGDYTGGSMN